MQSSSLMGAMVAGAMLVAPMLAAGAACAQASDAYRGEAKLASAATTPVTRTIAGADWRCEGEACVGVAAHHATLDNLVRECKKVAAALGPLTAFTSDGRAADAGQLRACNTAATVQTATRN